MTVETLKLFLSETFPAIWRGIDIAFRLSPGATYDIQKCSYVLVCANDVCVHAVSTNERASHVKSTQQILWQNLASRHHAVIGALNVRVCTCTYCGRRNGGSDPSPARCCRDVLNWVHTSTSSVRANDDCEWRMCKNTEELLVNVRPKEKEKESV